MAQRRKSRIIEIPDRANSNKVIKFFFLVCTHNAFNICLTACIILNTALLAMDRYPIELSRQDFLESMNGILSWVFFCEMVIKLIGLGIKEYAADSFNLFDCTVVVISIIDLVITKVGAEFDGSAISALRAVRLLRVFKLARSWTSFRLLLEKMIITIKDIRNFSVLMFLFMFIYTLLGMELYGYKVLFINEDLESVAEDGEDGEFPRANFNTFLSGFTTIFIVFIGEDWNSSMYDHVRTRGYGAIFFFVSLFILGNLVLLNLFLAILLKNFEEPPGKDEEDDDELEGVMTKIKGLVAKLFKCCPCFKKDNTTEGS
jgi:voltage-dependent calcium channel L type alpha-1D